MQGIEIGAIIAIAMAVTPFLSDWLHIPKKLRSWVALALIVVLNVVNALLLGDGDIYQAVILGIEQGVVAVGLYSGGKNTIEYVRRRNFPEDEDLQNNQPFNYPNQV